MTRNYKQNRKNRRKTESNIKDTNNCLHSEYYFDVTTKKAFCVYCKKELEVHFIPTKCKYGDVCLSCGKGKMIPYAKDYPGKEGIFACTLCGFEINTKQL